MITLKTNAKFDEPERLIDRISKPGSGNTRKMADGIRQQFQANFTRQGSGAGAWAPLAPATIAQRQALGYAGQRPILVRSGDYRRSFLSRGGDNHERIWQSAVGLSIEVGSDDRRARWLELGTSRMPPRPVTILDDGQEQRLIDIIDYVIAGVERDAWR